MACAALSALIFFAAIPVCGAHPALAQETGSAPVAGSVPSSSFTKQDAANPASFRENDVSSQEENRFQKHTPLPPGERAFSWGGYFEAVGILLLLLGALWLVVWYLKRKGALPGLSQGNLPRGALRVEGALAVGPRKGLLVVRFFDRLLLLGMTDHQITLLTEMDDHDAHDATASLQANAPSAEAGTRPNGFESILRALGKRQNTSGE